MIESTTYFLKNKIFLCKFIHSLATKFKNMFKFKNMLSVDNMDKVSQYSFTQNKSGHFSYDGLDSALNKKPCHIHHRA